MGMHGEFQARIELSDRGVLVVRDMISAVARLGRDEVWHELSKTYPELAKFAANKDADMIPFCGDYEFQGLRFSFRLDLKNRRSHALEAFVNFVIPFIAYSAVIVSAAEERDAKLNVLTYEYENGWTPDTEQETLTTMLWLARGKPPSRRRVPPPTTPGIFR